MVDHFGSVVGFLANDDDDDDNVTIITTTTMTNNKTRTGSILQVRDYTYHNETNEWKQPQHYIPLEFADQDDDNMFFEQCFLSPNG
jgi:hypothetical protein